MTGEEKKLKLTDSEKMDIILRNQKRQGDEIKRIKEKKEETKIGEDVKKMISNLGNQDNDDFMLQGNLHSLPQVMKEEQQQFFKELRVLMVKYKIINVIANLVKKF